MLIDRKFSHKGNNRGFLEFLWIRDFFLFYSNMEVIHLVLSVCLLAEATLYTTKSAYVFFFASPRHVTHDLGVLRKMVHTWVLFIESILQIGPP